MNDKELWELMSIISEGQDSEQRRKVEQYITDLQKEIERLNNIIKRFEEDLREVYLTFGEFSEEYTENRIKELKGSDKE